MITLDRPVIADIGLAVAFCGQGIAALSGAIPDITGLPRASGPPPRGQWPCLCPAAARCRNSAAA
ncbi:MAG TPA: hypothetical protein VFW50_22695 [Streptosporangiaceae bacterium]|nr:hypothetical protein [Streptosporangiaceae bacterium]